MIDCPHCGKPTELLLAPPPQEAALPRRAIAWTLVAVLILGLGLAGALLALKRVQRMAEARKEQAAAQRRNPAPPSASPSQVPEPSGVAAKAGFQISAIKLEKAPGTSLVYAVGTLNNPATRQRFGVQIELNLFDASGKKVGAARDYQPLIEPQGQWQFKALVVDSQAATAELASIKEEQ